MEGEQSRRVWDVLLRVMVPITLAFITWSLANISSTKESLAVMDAQVFYKVDAYELERRINDRYAALDQKIATIETNVAVIRQILESQK